MAFHLLYGGTFDPVHEGHLAVARAAMAACAAEGIALLPAADPPHRNAPGASAQQRADMLHLAVKGQAGLGVDVSELQRAGPSFTIDTLRAWRTEHGDRASLGFVVGADAFLDLATWREWRALLDMAHWVVAHRPGSPLEALAEPLASACQGRWAMDAWALHAAPGGRLLHLALPPQPESATALRQALALGQSHPLGLPPAVAEYIAAHRLYR